MIIPEDLKYTKTHEWLKVEGEKARTGITDYAQNQLGDIVFVELPGAGKTVERGKMLATVESVKAVSDVYAPVSGTVKSVNPALDGSPEKVNTDPYGKGWIADIEIVNPDELKDLLDAASYAKHLQEAEQ
ncbi:MAG: glycine cleavage system protein GcvH [Bacillota bacterium]